MHAEAGTKTGEEKKKDFVKHKVKLVLKIMIKHSSSNKTLVYLFVVCTVIVDTTGKGSKMHLLICACLCLESDKLILQDKRLYRLI